MLRSGDYVNYHFGGKPDTWLVKPPLAIWSIVASYRVFGFNEFALRFPSALAVILTTLVVFVLVQAYRGPQAALVTCLMMLSCKGLVGSHVGRTGDTDALLVLFLTLFAAFSLYAIDFHAHRTLVLAGLAMALAFYTKSTASVFLLPGLFVYAILRSRLKAILISPYFWIGLLLLVGAVASWYLLVSFHGHRIADPDEFGANAWQRMFLYDTWHRFTGDMEGHGTSRSPRYFLRCLDVRFSPWIYLFYLGGIIGLAQMIRRFRGHRNRLTIDSSRGGSITLASVCIVLTFGIVLTLSRSKLNWYVAPIIPFLSVMTYSTYHKVTGGRALFRYLLAVLLVAFLGIQIGRIGNSKVDRVSVSLRENSTAIRGAEKVLYTGALQQHHRLYLSWYSTDVEPHTGVVSIGDHPRALDEAARLFQVEAEEGVYILFTSPEEPG
jgi:4-amino-4-deoxy-L-arabinose transferase-like glycosyltransferase